ncbi:CRISPR-associated protein [Mitsuokella sp. WILCCON 0060]|uniref:CRISPR-associated protein n=1 Tax=Mitsuokella sp. WILCCON 0060 TaxID=3345341 RepID=UPI003F1C59FF
MDAVFVNHTNHPSAHWAKEELQAARSFGEVMDIGFPAIPSTAEEADIWQLARDNARHIAELSPAAVLCQGEFTYTYALVTELLKRNICVLAACSERIVEEHVEADGSTRRISQFRFTRFRRYGCL